MKQKHTPRVNARYWTAITLASVAGTNLGDFYAHESGLGIVKGLMLLALLTAMVFLLERSKDIGSEAYYWIVILLIRTGATNIADYLAYRVRVPELPLTLTLVGLLALFGWGTSRRSRNTNKIASDLPGTSTFYWLAMLSAGVLGTVVGDICQHQLGRGTAVLSLTALLVLTLLAARGRAARSIMLYWTTVAIARTAGTALGDWLAENKALHIGLPLSTAISCCTFLAILFLWRTQHVALADLQRSPMKAA